MSKTRPLPGDPNAAAAALFKAYRDQADWLDAFAGTLDRCRRGDSITRILATWGLSQSEAARLFGVSRQAVGKWLGSGPPVERAIVFADLAAATDLLLHYLKPDRISAVVRRPAAALNDESLLDLLGRGESAAILAACRAMFQFDQANSMSGAGSTPEGRPALAVER